MGKARPGSCYCQRMLRAGGVGVLLATCCAAALVCCGSFGSSDDAPVAAEAGDGSASGADGAMGGEGGSLGEAGVSPCDPNEAPPAYGTAGVYVSAPTGQAGAGATGAPDNPFKTIKEAVSAAKSLGATTLVLDEGTYGERVDLDGFPAGVTLDGAWKRTGAVWKRDCAPDRMSTTLIQSPDDYGVTLKDLGVRSVLRNLGIRTPGRTATANDTDGASRIAILATNSIVALDTVSAIAGEASHGGAAAAGAAGATPVGTSLSCVDAPTSGVDRDTAPAASYGTFEPGGFHPAPGVAGAQSGGDGTNGTAGGAASSRTDCQVDGQCAASGSTCNNVTGTISSKPGRCGLGGAGGTAGAAGRGGGASIALLAVGGSVTIKNSELVASTGGDGTTGGAGGPGAAGGAGAAGANADCWTVDCCVCGTCGSTQGCGCYKNGGWNACCGRAGPTDRVIAGGGAGGAGAAGGRGETGGGGAGGPSFAYVPVASAQVLFVDSRRAFGKGGLGGGAAPGGIAGEKP